VPSGPDTRISAAPIPTPRLTECADRGMIGVLFEIVSDASKPHATWRDRKDGASF
jgi:hypothetical protein